MIHPRVDRLRGLVAGLLATALLAIVPFLADLLQAGDSAARVEICSIDGVQALMAGNVHPELPNPTDHVVLGKLPASLLHAQHGSVVPPADVRISLLDVLVFSLSQGSPSRTGGRLHRQPAQARAPPR